jgi:hypothetical protein
VTPVSTSFQPDSCGLSGKDKRLSRAASPDYVVRTSARSSEEWSIIGAI